MANDRDFEVLYRDDDAHVRGNANLPGLFVLDVTLLNSHSVAMGQFRQKLEQWFPGFEKPEHEEYWTWEDFWIPGAINPAEEFVKPYLQISRSEGMKGSEQVTRGFQAPQQATIEGVGQEPNLLPRPQVSPTTVVIQNGMREAKKTRGILGLGRK